MEDRITPGLYLEMTSRAPEEYAQQRVPQVLAQAGVQRATWWQNVVPHRTDLPRELDEFSVLGSYEVDTEDPEAAFRGMTPRVIERLGGGFGTPAFDAWAYHEALRIMYVNSFRRVGERLA